MDLAPAPSPAAPPRAAGAAPRGGGGATSAATAEDERNARTAVQAGHGTAAAADHTEGAGETAGAPPVAPATARGYATVVRRAAADAATAAARVAIASRCRGGRGGGG